MKTIAWPCCSGNAELLVSGRDLIEAVRQRRKSGTNGRRVVPRTPAGVDSAEAFIDALMAAAVDYIVGRLSNYRDDFKDTGPIPGLLDVLVACEACLDRTAEVPQVWAQSSPPWSMKVTAAAGNMTSSKTAWRLHRILCDLAESCKTSGAVDRLRALQRTTTFPLHDASSRVRCERRREMLGYGPQVVEGCIGASVQAEFQRLLKKLSSRGSGVPKDADRIVEVARGCSEMLDEEVAYYAPLFSSHIKRPAELAAIKVHQCLNQHLLPWLQTGEPAPSWAQFAAAQRLPVPFRFKIA